MKQTIPFKKDITFKTKIGELTAIALDNDLTLKGEDLIVGNFYISGTYKMLETSAIEEEYSYKIPCEIAIASEYDTYNATIDIDDFYYEIINDEILRINIVVVINNLERKEIVEEELEDEENNRQNEYITQQDNNYYTQPDIYENMEYNNVETNDWQENFQKLNKREQELTRLIRSTIDKSKKDNLLAEYKSLLNELENLSNIILSTRIFRNTTKEERDGYINAQNVMFSAQTNARERNSELKRLIKELDRINERFSKLDFEIYLRLAGEVEARNAVYRWLNILQYGSELTPLETAEVSPEDAVYIVDGMELSDAELKARQMEAIMDIKTKVTTRDEVRRSVSNQSVKNDMLRSKGWYDTESDTIYIVADNNSNEADLESSILHEAIAH